METETPLEGVQILDPVEAEVFLSETAPEAGSEVVLQAAPGGALAPIKEWAGDVFYTNRAETTTYKGYQSVWVRDNRDTYMIKELPFDVAVTTTSQVLDAGAVFSGVMVVLVAITILTGIKSIFRR